MNKIFKIVFNAARGKMMVVNEATSSVQTGKKAAVTVAIVAALASGSAMAATFNYGIDVTDSLQSESQGYRIDIGDTEASVSFDSQTATATFTDKQVIIDDARVNNGGALHAGVQVKAPAAQPLQPKIVMDGGEGTSLDIEVTNGWGIVSRFAQVQIGSEQNELDTITIESTQDAAIYVTGGHADDGFYYANNQVLDLYAKEIYITGEITGNEGRANIVASQTLSVDGDISANVTEYGNAADLTLVLHGGAESSINGNIKATNEALIDITLGQRSTIAGGTIVASSSTDYTGGEIAIKLGEGSKVNSDVTAQDGGNISLSFGDDGVLNGNITATNDGNATVSGNTTVNGLVKANNGGKVQLGSTDTKSIAFNATGEAKYVDGAYVNGGEFSVTGETIDMKISNTKTADVKSTYGVYVRDGGKASLIGSTIDLDVSAANGKAIGLGTTGTKNQIAIDAKELSITASGDNSIGIQVSNNTLQIENEADKSRLDIKAEKTTITANYGIEAMAKGIVTVESDLIVDAKTALLARGEAQIVINQSRTHDVKLNGDIAFNYDAATSGTSVDADVNVNLVGSNSFLEGNILVTGENIPDGFDNVNKMALNLTDGATWTSTADSFVNTLEMNKNGIVAIGENTVEVKDLLKGDSGTVVLGAETSKFVVSGDDELGSLTVKKAGATADTMTADDVADLLDNVIGVTNVQAMADEGQVQGAIVVGADGEVERAVNSKTEALADKVWLAPNMITRIMMNDVRKRMGDLRAAEGTHGVWARYNGGQMSGSGVDADFSMVQVGIDTVPVVDAPRFGVAFSYAETESKDNLGTTDMDSFSLAFYGTKMYDNGMFVDVIGRMATMDSDIVNVGAKGKMDNVALSLSGELGWRFDVTDRFFFEPSVEATYTYTNADTFTMTNGGTYELEAMDSLVGRAGFAAGFKCPANKGDVYVRAAVVHEFMGDATINSWTANGAATPIESDGKDTWFEYAIGAQFNVNKNTYVYADIERTEGATMDEDWRANVGVRFAF